MEAAGLDSSAVIEGDLSAQSGYITGCDLARSPELTGVVAANDQMALGLLNGLQVNGIHIPQEMSVVGLNDQPGAKYFSPPLTTVRPDLAALGSICAEVWKAGPHQVTGQDTPQSILIYEIRVDRPLGTLQVRKREPPQGTAPAFGDGGLRPL